VGVDPQGERWVTVLEVFGQFLDGDTPGEHDAGVALYRRLGATAAGPVQVISAGYGPHISSLPDDEP
jgi:hypothetical protein